MFDVENIANALTELGIDGVEIRCDEVYAKCPGHMANLGREDRSPSWHMNTEGMHNCWSCQYSGNLVSLVIERLDLVTKWGLPNYEAAEKWITENVGDVLTRAADRLADYQPYITIPPPVPMTEARLAVFSEPPDWALRARGIDRMAAAGHGVLWEPRNKWWITPIRHPITHALMGWQEKGEGSRYFKNRPQTVKKSMTLFGLREWLGDLMIVVESPLDVAHISSVYEVGVAVATFGAKISEKQIALMKTAGTLIIAMDNDDAGRQAARKLLIEHRLRCLFFNYGDPSLKDPGEMTGKEIDRAITTAMTSVHGVKAFTTTP